MKAKFPSSAHVAWWLVVILAIGLAVAMSGKRDPAKPAPKPRPRQPAKVAENPTEKPEERLPEPPAMDQGNAAEGTPEQEAKWRASVRRAQSIAKSENYTHNYVDGADIVCIINPDAGN